MPGIIWNAFSQFKFEAKQSHPRGVNGRSKFRIFQKCETLNARLPAEIRSYSRETWGKPISDDSAHFDFWRRKFFGRRRYGKSTPLRYAKWTPRYAKAAPVRETNPPVRLRDDLEYCLEQELNRTFLYTIRGETNTRKYTQTPSTKFFVGPCGQLNWNLKFLLKVETKLNKSYGNFVVHIVIES